MLEEFLERNQTYSVHTSTVSNRCRKFTLYNIDNHDIISVVGIQLPLVHKKYKDELKNGVYRIQATMNVPYSHYLIEGEIYKYFGSKLERVSNVYQPVLVQELKTKNKVIANGYKEIEDFVRLLIINGNMKGTREKKRADRPMVRYVRPGELGLPLRVFRSWGGKQYLTFGYDNRDNSITYDLPIPEMKTLMKDNYVKIDKDYHTAVILPKILKEETIAQTNAALLFEFGTRNDKPIFRVELQLAPSLKGEKIC